MELFTLKNKNGLTAIITDYGGRVTKLLVPDKKGHFDDVVLGYDNPDDYLTSNEKYYGATIGRYANRIQNGTFSIGDKSYLLDKNNGPNCLHGGNKGFHNFLWNVNQLNDQSLELSGEFNDMEDGFPGNLKVRVVYSVSDYNELIIEYFASTDKTTVVNFTHHSFFNLTGNPQKTIYDHILQINSDFITPVNENLIPTGELLRVDGTPFDFRKPVRIGERIEDEHEQLKLGNGYDHNWVLNDEPDKVHVAAKVTEPTSGRTMEVLTNEPGMQFYAGNFLNGQDTGKGDIPYRFRTAFCLETQHYPDSPNNPDFPSTLLNPGESYYSVCKYKFGVL